MTGEHKYHYPLPKLFVLGILAGARWRARVPPVRVASAAAAPARRIRCAVELRALLPPGHPRTPPCTARRLHRAGLQPVLPGGRPAEPRVPRQPARRLQPALRHLREPLGGAGGSSARHSKVLRPLLRQAMHRSASGPAGRSPAVVQRRLHRPAPPTTRPPTPPRPLCRASPWASRSAWWPEETCSPATACTAQWASGKVRALSSVPARAARASLAARAARPPASWLTPPPAHWPLHSTHSLLPAKTVRLCPLNSAAPAWASMPRTEVNRSALHSPLSSHPVAPYAGRFGLYGWARMLLVSYFSNLVGALLLVGLMKGGDGERVRGRVCGGRVPGWQPAACCLPGAAGVSRQQSAEQLPARLCHLCSPRLSPATPAPSLLRPPLRVPHRTGAEEGALRLGRGAAAR